MTSKKKCYFLFLGVLITSTFNASAQVFKIDIVQITDSTIVINNCFSFSLPISPDSLASYLGRPRFDPGIQNSIYFWDTLGVMGFVPNNTSTITHFDICTSEELFNPTTFYQGKIQIGDSIIDSEITKSQFTNIYLKKETKNFMPKLIIGNWFILVEFDEETNKLIGIEIYKKDK